MPKKRLSKIDYKNIDLVLDEDEKVTGVNVGGEELELAQPPDKEWVLVAELPRQASTYISTTLDYDPSKTSKDTYMIVVEENAVGYWRHSIVINGLEFIGGYDAYLLYENENARIVFGYDNVNHNFIVTDMLESSGFRSLRLYKLK